MKLTTRLNNLVHPWMVRYVQKRYLKRIRQIFQMHPESFRSPDAETIARHKRLWGPLLSRSDDKWLQLFCSLSGKDDARFVPEDVFYCVIERCLNNCDAAGKTIEDKNDVCFYIPEENRPKTVIRYVRGVFFDGDGNPITKNHAEELLSSYRGDVVGKPTMNSCGGAGVHSFTCFPDGRKVHGDVELSVDWIVAHTSDFVVQGRLSQEPVISSFNPASINTCRIMTFRRPWSGDVSPIAAMLRIGCANEVVDNLASGGISVDIALDGRLADFAVDHDFKKFDKHPVSKIPFSNFVVPYYEDMCKLACNVARKVPAFNLLSFDMIATEAHLPCIIEINATSMTLSQLQTRRPLFGEETDDVIKWCLENKPSFDVFNHFRTFY